MLSERFVETLGFEKQHHWLEHKPILKTLYLYIGPYHERLSNVILSLTKVLTQNK